MKLKKLIYGILTATVFSACADKMEYHEYNNYDEDYVKLNFGNVGGLITDIYLKLDTDFGNYSGAMLASATDEAEYAYTSNDIVDFYDGSWSPTNAKSSMWSTCYEGIANCNHYLDKFTGLTFPELELNDDYVAQMGRYNNYPYEVRFLRAYFYFNLVRQYGDVPFADHMLDAEESNTLSRRPAQEIFDYIISECDEIKDLIIEDYSKVDRPIQPVEGGRANKMTVLALKARAALFAASPLFNPTGDTELWHRAALANMEVVNACEAAGMTLVPKYETLWATKNYSDAIKEIIFGRRANRTTSSTESYNYPAGLTGSKGGNCPTQTLVDAYEMTDGKPYDESGLYSPNDPYSNRDPRFALTIAYNGDMWPNWNETPLQTYQGGLNGQPITGGTPTGYYLKKLCHADIDLRDNSTNKADNHTWVTFRLGEFYLNFAEALFKYLDGADVKSSEFVDKDGIQVTARQMASKTRTRVNMPEFPTGMTNDIFWKKYQNERMVELAFEGHRFWDVRRWKEADKFFTNIAVMKITASGGIYTYNRETVTRMWNDKMYLFPIPRTEIMKNPNLTQNPGW
ncbi:RagB/SusD family nutrient uptake outer membrane protein [Bacteroides sp.]|uniref:RagB/SusD family nutrient uptake outer membrane protein n=1 Tax=Bacteroides sp. TaxID=29523 RepID=UPI0025C59296|nr:RagB/SusD family nutrient uptake outer membrane protein [Bacteroides sp.]